MAELLPKIAELSERLQKDPGSRLFVPLAEEYIKAGMLEEAVQVLGDGLKKHPEFFGARVALGRVYFEQRKFREAKGEFEQVLKASPDNLVALRKLLTIYKMEGERDKLRRCCETLLAANSRDAEAQKFLDELNESVKRDSPAVQVADAPFEVERATPPSAPAPQAVSTPEPSAAPPAQERTDDDAPEELVSPTLAQLYLRQGHYAQAVRVYDELLRREPQNESYRQSHTMALTLLQGQQGGAPAGPDTAAPSSAGVQTDAPSSGPPAEPSSAPGGGFESAPPAVNRPPKTAPNAPIINKLESWLLRIQHKRRRSS